MGGLNADMASYLQHACGLLLKKKAFPTQLITQISKVNVIFILVFLSFSFVVFIKPPLCLSRFLLPTAHLSCCWLQVLNSCQERGVWVVAEEVARHSANKFDGGHPVSGLL